MTKSYTARMTQSQTLPLLWLLSDARNDEGLEDALKRLPRGSGFVFRHYHLAPTKRRERFDTLHNIASKHGHCAIVSDDPAIAKRWGADGVYGSLDRMRRESRLLKLATAHDLREIVAADRMGVDGIFLSPVLATRSHSGAQTLGVGRFRMLARQAKAPVIALGGMNRANARRLDWPRWGAIDGLSASGVRTQDS